MEQPVHPLPLCPYDRIEYKLHEFREIIIDGCPHRIIDTPYYFYDKSQISSHDHNLLSKSSHHSTDAVDIFRPHRLFLLNDEEGGKSRCWCCNSREMGVTHYFCAQCEESYHKECVESPPEIKYPCHPRHPLKLIFYDPHDTDTPIRRCYCCREDIDGLVYFCSICNFTIHPICGNKPSLIAINHPKSHDHILTLLPRQVSFTCNACALSEDGSSIYVCLQCDFMVHGDCIYLPRVIKISRHQHRLSHTSSLPSGEWSCGVCRTKVDGDYGEYSCVDKGCPYVVHSKCATRKNIWDRKDLEGEPEDTNLAENVEPFGKIDDATIRHFSHEHNLRLLGEEISTWDENKRCQACVLPIYEGNFYICKECNFILHETCANLPLKKPLALHPHPLTLEVYDFRDDDFPQCETCFRYNNGFMYKCSDRACGFEIDVRCAQISEPFTHGGHPHPLFLTSSWETLISCRVCGIKTSRVLNCTDCDFVLCFTCATLPCKVRHKCDEHLLALCYDEEDASGSYWCEICEERMNPLEWFYTCDDCGVTLHIECVLGRHPYLMCRGIEGAWRIRPSNSMSRPICIQCESRCRDNIVFERSGKVICTDCWLLLGRF